MTSKRITKKLITEIFENSEVSNDNDAVEWLKDKYGIEIARRTITDYRHKWGVPAKSKKDIVTLDYDQEEIDIDELWDSILKMQKAISGIRRDERQAVMEVNVDEPIGIAFMGDIHIGDIGTDYNQLKEDVQLIKQTENLYLTAGGDYLNNFVKRNRNYNEYEVIQPRLQWKLVEWFFNELEDSIAAICTGNHDNWTEELTQFDALESIVRNLNFLYTKHGAKLTIKMPGTSYDIKFKHNYRAGSALNPTHGVKQMIRMDEDADIGALFDTHVGAIEEFVYKKKWRVAIRTGTYKHNDHWAHSMGFDDDAHPCVPVVILHPQKRYFQVARSLQQGVDMLEWARDAYQRDTFGNVTSYQL